jgi:hypothetical protein
MEIEVLHIDACPNWREAGRVLIELLDELGIDGIRPTYTLIGGSEGAARHPFAGSPTILIDGVDAVPGAQPITELACRIYRDGPRTAGIPTRASLRAALQSRL